MSRFGIGGRCAKVRSGGVDIAYEVIGEGSGLPVVLIPGLRGLRAGFMAQAAALANRRPVVLHDQRGTGESGRPGGPYTVHAMARDVVSIMDHAGIDKAHVVGTSAGGAIAQVLCIDYPERVQSAVLCCSWMKCDAFQRRQFEMRKRIVLAMGTETLILLMSTMLNDPKWFTEHYAEIAAREKDLVERASGPQIEAERIDAMMAFDESRRLGRIRVPVAVCGSRNDAVCPPHYSEQLAAAIPGARLKFYEDGGHFFHIVRADRFNADLEAFMQEHE